MRNRGLTFTETFLMASFAFGGVGLSASRVRAEPVWGSLVLGLCAVLLIVCLIRLWRMGRG